MIGGDSKLVLTCTHKHTCSHTHTHTTHISKLKEIEISHTLAKWGSGSRKKKKTHLVISRVKKLENFPLVSTTRREVTVS